MKKLTYALKSMKYYKSRYLTAILFIGISLSIISGIYSIIESKNYETYQDVIEETPIHYQMTIKNKPIPEVDFTELEDIFVSEIKDENLYIECGAITINEELSNVSIISSRSVSESNDIHSIYFDPSLMNFEEFSSFIQFNFSDSLDLHENQVLIDEESLKSKNLKIGETFNISKQTSEYSGFVSDLTIVGSFKIQSQYKIDKFLYSNIHYDSDENVTTMLFFKTDIIDIIEEIEDAKSIDFTVNYNFDFGKESNIKINDLWGAVTDLDTSLRSKPPLSNDQYSQEQYLKHEFFIIRQRMILLNLVGIGINVPLILLCVIQIYTIINQIFTDRAKEFGLLSLRSRKKKEIFSNLITESLIVSLSGGFLGVIFGELIHITYSLLQLELNLFQLVSRVFWDLFQLRNLVLIFIFTPILTMIIYYRVFSKKNQMKMIKKLKMKVVLEDEIDQQNNKKNRPKKIIGLCLFYISSFIFTESFLYRISDSRSFGYMIVDMGHTTLITLIPILIIFVLIILFDFIKTGLPRIFSSINRILQRFFLKKKEDFTKSELIAKSTAIFNSKIVIILVMLFCFVNLFGNTATIQANYNELQTYQTLGGDSHFFFDGSFNSSKDSIDQISIYLEDEFDMIKSTNKIYYSQNIDIDSDLFVPDRVFLGLFEPSQYLPNIDIRFVQSNASSLDELISIFERNNKLILVPEDFLVKNSLKIGGKINITTKNSYFGEFGSENQKEFTIFGSYEALSGVSELYQDSQQYQYVFMSSLTNFNLDEVQIDAFSLFIEFHDEMNIFSQKRYIGDMDNFLKTNFLKYEIYCFNSLNSDSEFMGNLIVLLVKMEKIFLMVILIISAGILQNYYHKNNEDTYSLLMSRSIARKTVLKNSNLNFLILLILSAVLGYFLSLCVVYQFNIFIFDNLFEISNYHFEIWSLFSLRLLIDNVIVLSIILLMVLIISKKYFSKLKIKRMITE